MTHPTENQTENRFPIHPPPRWGFSMRMALPHHELKPIAGSVWHLRSFVLQIFWPNGGYVWQTPVDLRIMNEPAAAEGEPQISTPVTRIWTFDRTRLALLAIGLVTALLIWRGR